MDQMGLDDAQKLALLGLSAGARSTLHRYRTGQSVPEAADQMERCANILRIAAALNHLFPEGGLLAAIQAARLRRQEHPCHHADKLRKAHAHAGPDRSRVAALSASAALALLKRLAAVKATVWRMVPRPSKLALLFAPGRPEAEADTVLEIMRAIGPLPYFVSGAAGAVRDQVIGFPLANPVPGRFNDADAGFGLWYAAFEPRTALAEFAWHYRRRKLLAGLDPETAEPEIRLLWSVPVVGNSWPT